jgi:MFS family permease
VFVANPAVLVACVIVGGLLLGIMNTVLTESVMEATELPRSVASSAYSGVRFLGAAVAPPLATLLAEVGSAGLPYLVGAVSLVLSALVVVVFRTRLGRIDGGAPPDVVEAEAIGLGDAA